MPSPRCTSHMRSVGEYIPLLKFLRLKFREEMKDKKAEEREANVSARLVEVMDMLEIKHECCRNMILNGDTRFDFIARRDAYG